ncbi:metalloregulator ArsR/SmtB family transcription factor [Spirosoma luteolum]
MNDQKKYDKLAYRLKILAHPVRMRILSLLNEEGELNVSSIGERLVIEQALLSAHLSKMKDRSILVSRRQGKEIFYAPGDPVITQVLTLLSAEPEEKAA